MIRRLRMHLFLSRLRFRARRRGIPRYSDAAIMLAYLAQERMRWTRETYEAAALAEVPRVRRSGLAATRDIDRVERALVTMIRRGEQAD